MNQHTADYILNSQLRWAAQANVPVEAYTRTVKENIFGAEFHADTRAEYAKGKGHELDGPRAHMKALYSSSALVVNVFDYWRRQNRIQDIAGCCGAEGVVSGMEFERTHPIKGVGRTPPILMLSLLQQFRWLLSRSSPSHIGGQLGDLSRKPGSMSILSVIAYGTVCRS